MICGHLLLGLGLFADWMWNRPSSGRGTGGSTIMTHLQVLRSDLRQQGQVLITSQRY